MCTWDYARTILQILYVFKTTSTPFCIVNLNNTRNNSLPIKFNEIFQKKLISCSYICQKNEPFNQQIQQKNENNPMIAQENFITDAATILSLVLYLIVSKVLSSIF